MIPQGEVQRIRAEKVVSPSNPIELYHGVAKFVTEEDPFTLLKGHLKISKMAKFENHIFQNSDDKVPKIREILEKFVRWPAKAVRLHTIVCKILRL